MRDDGAFPDLAAVIADEAFPRLDQALRSGGHIDAQHPADYQFLVDASPWLEPHYRRYGADLVHAADGFFYLRPVGERLPARRLSPAEMLVGQVLALFALEPATLEAGAVTRGQLLERLRDLVGNDALLVALNPRRRGGRATVHRAEANARRDVSTALRRLARLGFVDLLDEDLIGLRDPLMRFVEPARGAEDPAEALAALVRVGEVAIEDPDAVAPAGPADADRPLDELDDDLDDDLDDGDDVDDGSEP